MNIIEAKNPKYITSDKSIIQLDVLFEGFSEYLPFGATADDVEPHGRELYARAVSGEFGEIASGIPEVSLEEAKAEKLEAVRTAFLSASETAHCMSSVGFEIDANETANRDINGLIVVMEARGKETELFRAYDNTFHEVTLDDLKTMLVEISEHGQKLYARKWQLEVSIQAATTAEELDAITITFDGVDVASTGGYVD